MTETVVELNVKDVVAELRDGSNWLSGKHGVYSYQRVPKIAAGVLEALEGFTVTALIEQLRDAHDWKREGFGHYKDVTMAANDAPFRAANLLEQVAGMAEIEAQEPVAHMNAKRDMTFIHGPYNPDDIPLYAAPVVSPDVAALKAELREISEALNDPADNLTNNTAKCIQSLRQQLAYATSEINDLREHSNFRQQEYDRQVEMARSVKTELEAARKDADRWRKYVELYSERYGVPESDVSDEIDAAIERAKGDVLDACKKAP